MTSNRDPDKVDEATKKAYEGHLDDIPGLFSLMEPMPDAINAVHRLAQDYDCYILFSFSHDAPHHSFMKANNLLKTSFEIS